MNKFEFARLISNYEYDFLSKNEHLGKNIILLTLGGSYAYGTNTPKSDIDIRGIALNSKSDLIGLSNFEQFVDNDTDTVIYGFNKIIKLLSNCNPNVIEILSPREDIYYANGLGRDLLTNRHMFLSKRAGVTFGGYAYHQLIRLENALCHDRYNEQDKQRHLYNTLWDVQTHLNDAYDIESYGDIVLRNEYEGVVADVNLSNISIVNLCSAFKEMNEIIKTYNKLSSRNKKKDNNHLNKHAMHLIRLYLMAIDIFEKEEVITYRKDNINLLMSIRNGYYMNDDGTYRSEFFDMVNAFQRRFDYAKANTSLPNKPDMKKIEEFVMYINEQVIKYNIV